MANGGNEKDSCRMQFLLFIPRAEDSRIGPSPEGRETLAQPKVPLINKL